MTVYFIDTNIPMYAAGRPSNIEIPVALIHVAAAKRYGADFILPVDRDFDRIKDVKRADPRELGPRQ